VFLMSEVPLYLPRPLPSEEETTYNVLTTFAFKPRPDSGLDSVPYSLDRGPVNSTASPPATPFTSTLQSGFRALSCVLGFGVRESETDGVKQLTCREISLSKTVSSNLHE